MQAADLDQAVLASFLVAARDPGSCHPNPPLRARVPQGPSGAIRVGCGDP